MNDKLILTDVDGVLLDWNYAFGQWMKRHGYKTNGSMHYDIRHRYGLTEDEELRLIRMFNESAWIRRLPPFRDAIKYVKKLHQDHGFVFHAITSLSDDEYSQHLRTKNLREMFGDTVFEKYVYLDCCAPKDRVLEQYKDSGCFWIEDKESNAEVGLTLGLDSVLMMQDHNTGYYGPVRTVKTWNEIYAMIVGE